MEWIKGCIKNQWIIYLAALLLCIVGLFCLYTIPVSPFPFGESDTVSVKLNYPGANADTVQKQVTEKVVAALSGTENVKRVIARSDVGQVNITLVLSSRKESDDLRIQMDIMRAIAASHLPATVSQPLISLSSSSSGLLSFDVTSDKLSKFEIDNFIQSMLLPGFKNLPGVVVAGGGQVPVIRISLIPEKLAEYHLNPVIVSERLNHGYQDYPLGQMYIGNETYSLGIKNNTTTITQLGGLVVGYKINSIGNPVYLKDIATIHLEPRSLIDNNYSEFNGKPSGSIFLFTRTKANPFQVSERARHYVNDIKKTLPVDINITKDFDMADIMKASFNEVVFTVGIASLLVLLIAMMFLGRFRTTLVPVITIPICLAATVVTVNLTGEPLTIFTLLAMVVATGLVVDDAIVVLENITRYHGNGLSVRDAVIKGSSEIATTIMGITATLLAVYLPITFLKGSFTSLLASFAVPLSAAVFVSGIVALTLTPVMCLVLVSNKKPNNYQKRFDHYLDGIIHTYQRMLAYVLKWPKTMLGFIVIVISLGGYFACKLPKTFFSADPEGAAVIFITGQPDDTKTSLRDKAKRFKRFYTDSKVQDYSVYMEKDSDTGRLSARLVIDYKKPYLRNNKKEVEEINRFIKDQNIGDTVATMPKFLSSGSGADVAFYLYGTNSANGVGRYS